MTWKMVHDRAADRFAPVMTTYDTSVALIELPLNLSVCGVAASRPVNPIEPLSFCRLLDR